MVPRAGRCVLLDLFSSRPRAVLEPWQRERHAAPLYAHGLLPAWTVPRGVLAQVLAPADAGTSLRMGLIDRVLPLPAIGQGLGLPLELPRRLRAPLRHFRAMRDRHAGGRHTIDRRFLVCFHVL